MDPEGKTVVTAKCIKEVQYLTIFSSCKTAETERASDSVLQLITFFAIKKNNHVYVYILG